MRALIPFVALAFLGCGKVTAYPADGVYRGPQAASSTTGTGTTAAAGATASSSTYSPEITIAGTHFDWKAKVYRPGAGSAGPELLYTIRVIGNYDLDVVDGVSFQEPLGNSLQTVRYTVDAIRIKPAAGKESELQTTCDGVYLAGELETDVLGRNCGGIQYLQAGGVHRSLWSVIPKRPAEFLGDKDIEDSLYLDHEDNPGAAYGSARGSFGYLERAVSLREQAERRKLGK